MNAYARHASAANRQSAEDARRLLSRMEGMTLDDIARGGRGTLVRPNTISFNTLILALANSGQPEAAEELLFEMEDSCLAINNAQSDHGGHYVNEEQGLSRVCPIPSPTTAASWPGPSRATRKGPSHCFGE